MSGCPTATEAEKRQLKSDYHARKNANTPTEASRPGSFRHTKHRGSLRRLVADAIDCHSSLFSAFFARGAVDSVVLADQGADGNILTPKVFEAIVKADPSTKVELLDSPHSFKFLDRSSGIVCKKVISAEVELRIHHDRKLFLRRIKWHVSEAETELVVLGRHVLQAIGCDNRALLAAA